MKQPAYPDLESMRNADIRDFDPDTIPNIEEIKIDTDKPVSERISEYISKAKNPYFNKSGKILVKIEYSETETTIEDCMEGFFRSLC